ncbi:MAG: PsbP-related protein [Nitrososphaeraceae archaeon]
MGSIIFLVFLAHPTYSQTQQEDSSTYDSELFSITYPLSWHVSDERGVTGEPGVILQNDQKDRIQSNRVTPRSHMDYSNVMVTIVPRSSLLGSSGLSALELVDSLMDSVFSKERLAYHGAQLVSDNYTSLSGIQARSVSFTTQGYFNLIIQSADDNNMYQIAYTGQESKVEKELPEVLSIISSFQIKGITDTAILSTA